MSPDRGGHRRRHRDDRGLPETLRAERARPGVPLENWHFDRRDGAEPGKPVIEQGPHVVERRIADDPDGAGARSTIPSATCAAPVQPW